MKPNMKYYGPGLRLLLLLYSFDIFISLFSIRNVTRWERVVNPSSFSFNNHFFGCENRNLNVLAGGCAKDHLFFFSFWWNFQQNIDMVNALRCVGVLPLKIIDPPGCTTAFLVLFSQSHGAMSSFGPSPNGPDSESIKNCNLSYRRWFVLCVRVCVCVFFFNLSIGSGDLERVFHCSTIWVFRFQHKSDISVQYWYPGF